MSKSNTWENALLALLFNATPMANVADNATSGPLTNLYVSLHTADPGEGGNQISNETNYTSYARVAVARSGSGWTVSGNQVTNAVDIVFPASTGGTSTVTHFAVGTDASGAGRLLYKGALTTPLTITTGVQPRFEANALTITED